MKTWSQERVAAGTGTARSGAIHVASRQAFSCSTFSVSTEISDSTDAEPRCGWVFYDGECAVCAELAGRFGGMLRRAGFALVAFQHPWAVTRLGLRAGEVPDAARVVTVGGKSIEGADAMLLLAGRFWWARPAAWIGRWAVAKRWMRRRYAWFAARRHCFKGACGLPESKLRNSGSSNTEQWRAMQ